MDTRHGPGARAGRQCRARRTPAPPRRVRHPVRAGDALLIVLFLAPMLIMVEMSIVKFPPNTSSGFTLQHYADVLTDRSQPADRLDDVVIGTTAMAIMLVIGIPLAYYMVFKAGKWELFILLSLVLADELAPVVKIYAWQVILGRNGIINWLHPRPSRRTGCCSAGSP